MADTGEYDVDGEDEVGIDDAARIAGRHVSTMRRYAAAGEGPPVYRRGRRYVYRRGEVEEWAAQADALVPIAGGPHP